MASFRISLPTTPNSKQIDLQVFRQNKLPPQKTTAPDLKSVSKLSNNFLMGDVDVVSDILKAAMEAYPSSNFLQSLAHQYLVRGWLSKKQLQGLFNKAQQTASIPPGKLATLEAQILKMPNRFKSDKPEISAGLYIKDSRVAALLEDILTKYPQHKRVLFLKTKFDNNEPLAAPEIAEIERFAKILLK